MKGGIIVDWNAIKAEYIAGGTSYRKLAEKYGVSESWLRQRGSKEKWNEQKKNCRTETEQKIVDSVSEVQSRAAVSALELSNNAAMDMLRQIATEAATKDLSIYKMDIYSRALKNLRSMLGVKPQKDAEEQQARIDNYRRQADADSGDKTINIIMGESGEDYSV